MTTPTSKVVDCYKSPLEAIKDDGLWPFIKDAVSGQTGQIVHVLLPDRKNDRAAGQSTNVTLAASHEESDFDPVSVTRWQRGITQEASTALLERFPEDDDQSSGLDYAKLDDEDLMRREETHESVMNYNDYASQPHIQQFHADMDRNESAEDYRKGGEEDDDGEDSHSDEISHGRQEGRNSVGLQFAPFSHKFRASLPSVDTLGVFSHVGYTLHLYTRKAQTIERPRVDASLKREFHRRTLTVLQARLSRGTSVKAMGKIDIIDLSRSTQRAGITASAPTLAVSAPPSINFGPLRRPWVYSPFTMARITCRVEMALETITHPGRQLQKACEGECDLKAWASGPFGNPGEDMLDQIIDMYGD
ncbi:hypothetical protein K4K49_006233 [Colletotrichum sp. SAR 10_70]|nr:hypothetical protein K4K50_005944 [Colletotrichum sp. SAR 10_71]KAI8163546.1 hypothetical protein K4K49_006233 [Colletotrichum sp. SAR 10_70]KAI8182091.1 hypothetical protein K4K51_001304 [Colletotrichum sp. SAR 10_75]KAI8189565.1 hypothetical protein KHU50_000705 [Colletotrichum sp. SAR 10_65]KAI8222168.1 hypothetical protein K4K54_007123 [Colletotrichum sp. SAR 10_86]KAI8253621.1 hypothetical protein K4K53_010018 [Colletotrichum sp. SAR 10_77]KAJ5000072.1 hypothetical protein K4K48_00321